MNAIAPSVALFILALDQLSKFLILQNIQPGDSIEVVRNVFCLTLIYNTGAAFGIFKNQTILFTTISILSILVIITYYIRHKGRAYPIRQLALAFIFSGALGNLIDRLRFGYVVDFLDFKIWPVFNIADSAITIGVFLLIFSMVVCNRKGFYASGII